MKISRAALLSAILVLPAIGMAQTATPAVQTPPRATAKPNPQAQANRSRLKSISDQERGSIKDLAARQGGERKAVYNDKTLAPAQRKAKLETIRLNYLKQRALIHRKASADRQALLPKRAKAVAPGSTPTP